ncbi:uncharacterized protein LOC130106298 [Rhinichthys klamathensis goyatoka]|uniref:uncharacterized protein LOC130106298 n=1 Tax=Rhinichthys klamathensis goyatoka TaxID=3034132 RepID=UPI0024B51F45|nr:uncharacterized protein LOC130106298 [Rhinichthys klamathensis goyatoka]
MGAGRDCKLLFITDTLSGGRLLVDSGAQRSILPAQPVDTMAGGHGPPMDAANGTPIRTYGTSWDFVMAAVSTSLLGADFLCAYRLLVDVTNCRLIDALSFASYPCTLGGTGALCLSNTLTNGDLYQRLLAEFPDITTPTFSSAVAKHGVEHYITTVGPPVYARARRLDPAKLAIAREEFATMEHLGIVRRSNSPWASPLHMVTKADGGWRPCGDFRRLNDATTPDRYPVPHIQDFSAHLAGATIFSKVDLVRGYHQVPVHPQDVPKTVVITPFGLFEFLRMPFGLKGAAQTFQRLMDSVLRDMPFMFVYLDDILMASASADDHRTHLRQLFGRLSEHGLIINPAKCEFGRSSVSFLGHHVTPQGAVPLPAKVEAVASFPRPRTVKSLQEFLGMVNFYNRFLPRAAQLMRPLYYALRGRRPADVLAWSPEMADAFDAAKTALANAALLAHPSPTAPVALTTDASDYAVGAVCVACQRAKVTRHTKAPLAPFKVPERRFDHVNVDLVGPLPPSRGYTYLLTMVDRTTRWPEVVPLSSTTSAEVARAFIMAWVARFGTPSDLSSDRGPQFTSELWSAVAEVLGVKVHRTTAYNPQSNGLCERFHRDMKAALRASLTGSDWADRLPWVMLGLRSAPKEDLQASSAELVYGQPLRVPGEFLPDATAPWSVASHRAASRDIADAFVPIPTSHHGLPRSYVPKDLPSAKYVFIRHDGHRTPLLPPYDGPFRVLVGGVKNFVVDMGGRPERMAIDRLKPAHVDIGEPLQLALPPRQGRPPAATATPAPAPPLALGPSTVKRSRYGRQVRPPVR